MGLVTVRDEWTKLVGHRFLNSQICLWIGLLQAIVCIWGLAQHCHSFIHYHKILRCDFLEGALPLEATDAIIFDIGLFHQLWGIRGCVAEYLDGGFGRLAWCITHIISLTVSLPFAFVSRPRPYFLWPLLIQMPLSIHDLLVCLYFRWLTLGILPYFDDRRGQQSAYGIGLLILFIAALPRILPQLMEPHAVPVVPISVYVTGTMLNFFLLYVYWHWYWHVDSLWSSAVRVRFGKIVRNANNRSRRDRPMIPKEPMEFPQPLKVDGLVKSSTIPTPSNSNEMEAAPTQGLTKSHDSNISEIFKQVEEELANGEVLREREKGKRSGKEALSATEEETTAFLAVPPVSKTVRARYPHEPPVIKALLKRGKEEVAVKQLDVAAKRAMYRKRATTNKVTVDLEIDTPDNLKGSIPRVEVIDPGEKAPSAGSTSASRRKSVAKAGLTPRQDKQRARASRKSTTQLDIIETSKSLKKPAAKPPNGSVPIKTRRRSTVTINPEPVTIESAPVSSEASTPSTPPPPIVATKVTPDAVENRVLKAQDDLRSNRCRGDTNGARRTRRLLPKTPDEHPSGEIPRPKFYLPGSEV